VYFYVLIQILKKISRETEAGFFRKFSERPDAQKHCGKMRHCRELEGTMIPGKFRQVDKF